MSPEQAAAAHHKLDHRTDIYSLGATLYELVTGQPVFQGSSAHDVISQILTAEPRPPHEYRPDLPRDLETILMKCLSKDAAQRYMAAQPLVDDLRAFLDGRPIAARRASRLERTVRWVKRQQRSVALTAAAVAVTLLLVVLSVVGGYAWQRSRLAFVMLNTARPPLVAEFLSGAVRRVPPATVPTQQRLEVAAGEYQLRLTGSGRLSQTYDVRLEPGQHWELKLDLDDQLLWSDVPLEGTFQLASFLEIQATAADQGGPQATAAQSGLNGSALPRTDIVCMTPDGLHCLSGQTGRPRWELSLREPTHLLLQQQVSLVWPWDSFVTSSYVRGVGVFDERPMLVSQADANTADSLDFNRDGSSDLLLATRNQAIVLAISGRDGTPLWGLARGSAAASKPPAGQVALRLGSVLYPPLPVADQDGDDVADVVAAFVTLEHEQAPPQRTVELISGASGEPIWRYNLPAELFELPQNQAVPYELRWFYGSGGGYSRTGGGFTTTDGFFTREHSQLERSGQHHYVATQPLIWQPSETIGGHKEVAAEVILVAGRRLIRLDLGSGMLQRNPAGERSPAELPARPAAQPLLADLDGDGAEDLLLSTSRPQLSTAQQTVPGRLVAWSVLHKTELWHRDLAVALPRQEDVHLPSPQWPQAIDLDGDGAAEVLTPTSGSEALAGSVAPAWGTLAILDGRTGEPRWQRQLFTMDQRLEHFTAGPDIDGDGVGEVYVASLWAAELLQPNQQQLFIDCLCGASGRTLWRAEQPLLAENSGNADFLVRNLAWHHGGGDWPQLIVPLRNITGDGGDRVYLFAAGTGRLMHLAPDVANVESADCDADGIADLLLMDRQRLSQQDQASTLRVAHGTGGDAWRRLIAGPVIAVGDLDGDGIRDLIAEPVPARFEALAGASGRRLWQTQLSTSLFYTGGDAQGAQQRGAHHPLLAPQHDLNGDGTSDVLVVSGRGSSHNQRPYAWALSGKSGRQLWQSEAVGHAITKISWVDCRDLDGDGKIEVVMLAAADHGLPPRSRSRAIDARLWLLVLSGRSGQTQWAQPLTFAAAAPSQANYRFEDALLEPAYADLNGDGVLDLVLPAQSTPADLQLEMRGISGADGKTLWRSPLPVARDTSHWFTDLPPAAVADVDGDGQLDVVLSSLIDLPTSDGRLDCHVQVEVLDGRTGRRRVQWHTPADRYNNQTSNRQQRRENHLRPLLIRRGTGRYWIAIELWNQAQELYVLDDQGVIVSQRLHPGSAKHLSRLWPVDVDGDGSEELLQLADSELMLLAPDRLDAPLWQETDNRSVLQQIVAVLPADAGPPTIAVQGGTDDLSLYGIDAKSGRQVWSCIGPTALRLSPDQLRFDLLSVPTAEVPPHVLYRLDATAIVRLGVGLPIQTLESSGRSNGENRATLVAYHSDAAESAATSWARFRRLGQVLPPVSEDPRLLRPLPWKRASYQTAGLGQYVLWAGFYGITLAVLPVSIVALMLWRRQWSLRALLGLLTVSAVFMTAVTIDGPEHDFQLISGKLLVAYGTAGPVIFAAMILARWLWLGRWQRVAIWLAAGLLASLVVMAISLSMATRYPAGALEPGERYSWAGWYWIFSPVFFLAAWALCLLIVIDWSVRCGWGGLRGTFRAAFQ